MGFSTRVTNRNPHCEMVKQTRLCMVRPCDQEHRQPTDKVQPWGKPPVTEEVALLIKPCALASLCDVS